MVKFIPNILTFTRFALTFVFLGMILYSPSAANRQFFLDITFVLIIRHITETRGLVFPAVATGKVKGVLQAFAIGTVIIKTAHVQTAAWGYWFTTVTFVLMLAFTIISGFAATRRSWWKKAA